MSPLFIAALTLLVCGLASCFFSQSAGKAQTVFWWSGLVLAIFGLILLLAAAVLFASEVVQRITGAHP